MPAIHCRRPNYERTPQIVWVCGDCGSRIGRERVCLECLGSETIDITDEGKSVYDQEVAADTRWRKRMLWWVTTRFTVQDAALTGARTVSDVLRLEQEARREAA